MAPLDYQIAKKMLDGIDMESFQALKSKIDLQKEWPNPNQLGELHMGPSSKQDDRMPSAILTKIPNGQVYNLPE